MAIQSSFYTGTALDGRTFPSSKHIATKAHMAIWKQRVSDNVWVQTDIDEYQLINNSCVLNTVVEVATYDQIEIRVADAPDELADNPTDIALVAGVYDDVSIVADIASNVTAVANDLAAVQTNSTNIVKIVEVANNKANIDKVATDIANVNTVGNNIADVNTIVDNLTNIDIDANNINSINVVANAINTGTPIGGGSGGQYHGNGIIKGIEYFANVGVTTDNIVIVAGTNALSVESFEIVNGASVTIENTSVWKVI